MGIELALRGPRLAIEAITQEKPDEAAVRTGEAVFWADTVAELTVSDRRHELSPALSMVRNAVAHGAVVCAGVTEGLTWPRRWPSRWADVIWVPTQQILDALDRTPSASRQAVYDQHLAGRHVGDALRDVLAHYQRVSELGDTPG